MANHGDLALEKGDYYSLTTGALHIIIMKKEMPADMIIMKKEMMPE